MRTDQKVHLLFTMWWKKNFVLVFLFLCLSIFTRYFVKFWPSKFLLYLWCTSLHLWVKTLTFYTFSNQLQGSRPVKISKAVMSLVEKCVIPENKNTPLEFIVPHCDLQRNFQVVSLLHKLLHKFQLFYWWNLSKFKFESIP